MHFEDLEVWKLSRVLTNRIYDASKDHAFSKDYDLKSQIRRAAVSVMSNIAEGYGRGTPADNRRFVRIARGSLNETQHWLRRAYIRKLVPKEKVEELRPLIAELGPRLNAYLKSIKPRITED